MLKNAVFVALLGLCAAQTFQVQGSANLNTPNIGKIQGAAQNLFGNLRDGATALIDQVKQQAIQHLNNLTLSEQNLEKLLQQDVQQGINNTQQLENELKEVLREKLAELQKREPELEEEIARLPQQLQGFAKKALQGLKQEIQSIQKRLQGGSVNGTATVGVQARVARALPHFTLPLIGVNANASTNHSCVFHQGLDRLQNLTQGIQGWLQSHGRDIASNARLLEYERQHLTHQLLHGQTGGAVNAAADVQARVARQLPFHFGFNPFHIGGNVNASANHTCAFQNFTQGIAGRLSALAHRLEADRDRLRQQLKNAGEELQGQLRGQLQELEAHLHHLHHHHNNGTGSVNATVGVNARVERSLGFNFGLGGAHIGANVNASANHTCALHNGLNQAWNFTQGLFGHLQQGAQGFGALLGKDAQKLRDELKVVLEQKLQHLQSLETTLEDEIKTLRGEAQTVAQNLLQNIQREIQHLEQKLQGHLSGSVNVTAPAVDGAVSVGV